MTITHESPASDIAATMHRSYYSDFAAAINTILACTPPDDATRPMRDRIITALDYDIADLLHNANLADLIPDAADMTDDAYLALETRLLDDDDFIAPLADLILADLANER